MKFCDWLGSRQGKGSEAIDLVYPSFVAIEPFWNEQAELAATSGDLSHFVTKVRRAWSADDLVCEAVADVIGAYVAEAGRSVATRDPMGEPFRPGARTTTADALLALTVACASSSEGFQDAVERARDLLKQLKQ